ncbi:hypothetical protein WR25_09000 [Diploscapter pachys]|uniref:Uncharacterized protein n=1 Tax=Diploscapter pachys TaxID=2018661 RepID=A0A2A2M172_9BILA|nr:hypothetical protein WR25_09000 [Diploscapter pachys]
MNSGNHVSTGVARPSPSYANETSFNTPLTPLTSFVRNYDAKEFRDRTLQNQKGFDEKPTPNGFGPDFHDYNSGGRFFAPEPTQTLNRIPKPKVKEVVVSFTGPKKNYDKGHSNVVSSPRITPKTHQPVNLRQRSAEHRFPWVSLEFFKN